MYIKVVEGSGYGNDELPMAVNIAVAEMLMITKNINTFYISARIPGGAKYGIASFENKILAQAALTLFLGRFNVTTIAQVVLDGATEEVKARFERVIKRGGAYTVEDLQNPEV